GGEEDIADTFVEDGIWGSGKTEAKGSKYGAPPAPPDRTPRLVARDCSPGNVSVPFTVQVKELIRKRLITFKRDRKGFFFQLFLPVGLAALVLLILMIPTGIKAPAK
ncbi:unnamed protein product, partial [Chrysoparadoxa australica]